MRALKGLVIAMGVLIAAGLVVIGVTIANRMSGSDKASAPAAAPSAVAPEIARGGVAPGRLPSFGELTALVPAGYAPVEMTADGDRLMVRLAADGRDDRILVIDLRSGRQIGTVVLERESGRTAR